MSAELDFDAVVIGAGFGGLRMLHECRELGLSVRVLEAGTDIGGTWYWNRYPGARTDTESWAYCFRFDQDLLDEWEFVERFPSQPQVHKYLTAVATKHDMFRDISFSTRVTGARWGDATNTWTVSTDTGESFRCRWLVSASGLLSSPLEIPFPGKDTFAGEIYMSNRWPKDEVSFAGKRVAVVGTGASAVQIIPEVAQVAEHLTVFQRTPNYVMPGRNHMVGERQREWIRNNYARLWDLCETQVFAFPWETENRFWNDTPPEKRERIFDRGWEQGGFQFAFKTYDDMLVVKECNDAASEYVRNKIRAIVDDPETAENLCPKDHPIFSKRTPLGHFYYETYNRPNVSLVPVKQNPIVEILPNGLKLADGSVYEVDMIIFALGFDAVTGAIMALDLVGRDGVSIQERWAEGAESYYGVAVDGFPNLFSIIGPQTSFTNIPPTIEKQCIFIGQAISRARATGSDVVEARPEAVKGWAAMCKTVLDMTLLPTGEAASWFLGTNVEGKRSNVLFFFGGAAPYYQLLNQAVADGFPGLAMEPRLEPAR